MVKVTLEQGCHLLDADSSYPHTQMCVQTTGAAKKRSPGNGTSLLKPQNSPQVAHFLLQGHTL